MSLHGLKKQGMRCDLWRLMTVSGELTGPSSSTYFENLKKYTLLAYDSFDIYWEGWRKPDTDLSFVDLDDGRQLMADVGV
jgi:hypothetical protein